MHTYNRITCLFFLFAAVSLVQSHSTDAQGPGDTRSTDYGLKIIAEGTNVSVDIVAVHGLDGHWRKTWTHENEVFWLQDLLPRFVPNSRIYSYGYDSRTHAMSPVADQYVYDFARSLVSELASEREATETGNRPIIFVAHSLGGLVVKSALIHAHSARPGQRENEKAIALSTYGILFLGTPHQGGQGVDMGKLLARIGSLVAFTSLNIIRNLAEHSEWLQQQQGQYADIASDFDTKFFYEIYKMHIPVYGRILVVPKYSAVIPGFASAEEIPLAADHKTMVKYCSSEDENFLKVVRRIIIMTRKASAKVEEKWRLWERTRALESGVNVSYVPEQSVEKFRIPLKLDQLRNRKFTGRTHILTQLHKALITDNHEFGPNIVVLFGVGGVGKTQLAVEFSYRYKCEFGAIFWIDGTSLESAQLSVLNVLDTIKWRYEELALDSDPVYHQIKEILEPGSGGFQRLYHNSEQTEAAKKSDPSAVAGIFLTWLSLATNDKWLLIYDNVDDLESFDIRQFFPRTSWGSIIITSRRPELGTIYPNLEVEEMEEDEAIELLEKAANIRSSIESIEYKKAQDIVQTLGYLPLAIIQAGAYISVQKMQLEEYLTIFHRNAKSLLARRPAYAVWNYRNDTVLTTWEISLAAVEKEMPEAAKLLHLCGFLAREDIWVDMLHLGQNLPDTDLSVRHSIHKLLEYSLIKKSNLTDGISLHPMVHLWVRERLPAKDRARISREAIIVLHRTFKMTNTRTSLTSRLVRHLEAVLQNARLYLSKSDHSSQLVVPSQKSSYWRPFNLFYPAYCWHLWARSAIKDGVLFSIQRLRSTPEFGIPTWRLIYELGSIYECLYQIDNARQLYSWCVAEAWAVLPQPHPHVLRIVSDLARSIRWSSISQVPRQDPQGEALQWYEWTLNTGTAILGDGHPVTLDAMLAIGEILEVQGHHMPAYSLFQQALVTAERVGGAGGDLALSAMSRIKAMVRFLNTQECQFALEVRAYVLNWEIKNQAPNLVGIAEARVLLVEAHLMCGREEEAESIIKQIQNDSEGLRLNSTYGEDYVDLLANIAQRALTLKKTEKAIKYCSLALQMADQFFGVGHSVTCRQRNILADFYLETRQLGQALNACFRVVFDWEIENMHLRPFKNSCSFENDFIQRVKKIIRMASPSILYRVIEYLRKCLKYTIEHDWFKNQMIYLYGYALLKTGQSNEALQQFQIAEVWNIQNHRDQGSDHFCVLADMGFTLNVLGQHDKGFEKLQRATDLARELDVKKMDTFEAASSRAFIYLRRRIFEGYIKQRDFDRALSYQKAELREPISDRLVVKWMFEDIEKLVQLGRREDAEELFDLLEDARTDASPICLPRKSDSHPRLCASQRG